MALTIETGAVISGADSFATLDEFVDYSANYGVTISDDDVTNEALLRRAYLQMDGMAWKGCPASGEQTGAWPRYGVVRNGYDVDSGSIPDQIVMGQMALAAEIYADDLDPPEGRKGQVKSETVDVISVTYETAPNYRARPASGRRSFSHFAGFLNSSSQIQVRRG